MISKEDLLINATKKLREAFGDDLFDLNQCRKLRDKYEVDIKTVQKKIDLSESTNEISISLANANNTIRRIENIIKQSEATTSQVIEYLEEVNRVTSDLEKYELQINILDSIQQYVKVVKCVESLSDELQKHLERKDNDQCTTSFANLTEIARHLVNTPALNLRNYLKETVNYWYFVLKSIFSKEFNQILLLIKWPFVSGTTFNEELLTYAVVKRLQTVIEYLMQIDLPEELMVPQQGVFSTSQHLCLPVQLLIEPLRKRFLFHFYGSRKTNRNDKPEWYFTKILSWIRDHTHFVENWIQPTIDKMGLYYIEVKVELMRGLVQLGIEKLHTELPNLQYDEFIFSHAIDEALGFDKELKLSYNYPINQPSVLSVLTQGLIFVKWLAMEKKFALEKMDAMLSSTTNDYVLLPPTENEDFKIMPSGEVFITLLQTITERYESLPQPGHRLQFLDLQLELLDDFRVRLLQLVNTEDSNSCRIAIIANTTFYIENVLIDWGQMLHFLNLYYYRNQAVMSVSHPFNHLEADIDIDTVFNETLSLYRHMKTDLLFTLVDSAVTQVKYKSKSYLVDNWSHMEKVKDIRSHSLTQSACPMFEVLASKLHSLEKNLTPRLFTIVWRLIAKQLDTHLFEKLILFNKFNEGGAEQLKFDITRNLLPLFAQYTDKPNSYCTYLSDACILLGLTKGSAILLKDTLVTLEGATGVEDRRGQALKEIGVLVLQPREALYVLNQRNDIRMYQMPSFD